MKFWIGKWILRILIVTIGVSILTLEMSRAALRAAVRWL